MLIVYLSCNFLSSYFLHLTYYLDKCHKIFVSNLSKLSK